MIRRALANAENVNAIISNKDDFENWLIINVAT